MAYLDESLAGGGSDVESSHHRIAREDERRDGQLTVDLLYCFKRRFRALPVQGLRGERKCFDAVARHTIAQRDLHLCFSLHSHDVVVNDLWELQAYPGQCCRGFGFAATLPFPCHQGIRRYPPTSLLFSCHVQHSTGRYGCCTRLCKNAALGGKAGWSSGHRKGIHYGRGPNRVAVGHLRLAQVGQL